MIKKVAYFMILVLSASYLPVYAFEDFEQEFRFTDNHSLFTTFVGGPGLYTFSSMNAFMPQQNINLDVHNPEDFFICQETYTFFVADTGNGRVLHFNPRTGESVSIGEGLLSSPFGVSVDAARIYIADAGLNEVVVLNRETHEVELRITRPESLVFGRATGFTPRKIGTDARGSIYVVSDNSPNGIMQFNGNGEFLGFVGENHAFVGFISRIQRMFFTQAQRDQLIDLRPPSPINLHVTHDGLLLTTTVGLGDTGVKKFSTAGSLLTHFPSPWVIDVVTDARDNQFMINQFGTVIVFDSQGLYLFSFSTSTVFFEMDGITRNPVAIGVGPTGTIYLLDRELSAFTNYAPTYFGNLVLDASYYLARGMFLEGEELWRRVVEETATFYIGHWALGFAEFRHENFETALDLFRLSYETLGHSRVQWHLRNEWILANLQYVLLALIIIYFVNKVFNFILRRKKMQHPLRILGRKIASVSPEWLRQFGREIKGAFYFLIHPFDAVYEIKRKELVSFKTATVIYLIYIFIFVLNNTQFTNFIFWFYMLFSGLPLPIMIIGGLFPIALLVVASFLVSDINEGEATFKQVYTVVACALIPYTLFTFSRAILSNILTMNEAFLHRFILYVGLGWTVVLIVVGLKEAYNYSGREILKNLFLTAFTSACIIVVIAVAAMLVTQEIEFLRILMGEVAFRVQS